MKHMGNSHVCSKFRWLLPGPWSSSLGHPFKNGPNLEQQLPALGRRVTSPCRRKRPKPPQRRLPGDLSPHKQVEGENEWSSTRSPQTPLACRVGISYLISWCFTNRQRSFFKKNMSGIIWINLDQQNFHIKSQGRLADFPVDNLFLSGAQLPKIAMMFWGCFWLTKNNENQGSWCPSRTILCQ